METRYELTLFEGIECSRGEMYEAVKDFLDKVNLVTTIGELESTIQPVLQVYGIQHYICTNMYGLECLADRKPMFGNWHTEWVDHYISNGYYVEDAVPQHDNGINNDGRPYYWSELIAQKKLAKIQYQIFREAWEADLREGLVIPLRVSKSELAMVSMAGKEFKQNTEVQGILHTISMQAHRKAREILLQDYGKRLMPDRLGRVPHPEISRLTPTELNILKFLAEDKSPADIAVMSGGSINTINKHSANIKKKLKVKSLYGAVAKAIRYGLFH